MTKPRPGPLESRLTTILHDREARSQRRRLTQFPANSVDFSSNSYLSLSVIPEIRQSYLCLLQQWPSSLPLFGSGGSRLLDGNTRLSETLEKEIAAFHGAETGLLFNSGFDANAGLFACLPQPDDVIVYDELAHASMHDGMRASRAAKTIPFKHNVIWEETDPNKISKGGLRCLATILEQLTTRSSGGISATAIRDGQRNVFVAVEGVYSMDGDVAPLREVVACIEHYLPRGNGYLIVDEAHSTGLFGPQGRGLVSELGLEKKVFARVHTFGKAMGASGAIILTSEVTRQYLINYARTLVYTTAMPVANLASIKVTYDFLTTDASETLRRNLRNLVMYTHASLLQICAGHRHTLSSSPPQHHHKPQQQQQPESSSLLHIHPTPPASPIIPLFTSEPRRLAQFCQSRGLIVRAIVAPTVPKGAERVRICLHAANTTEEVDRLCRAVEEWAAAYVEGQQQLSQAPIQAQAQRKDGGEATASGSRSGSGGGWLVNDVLTNTVVANASSTSSSRNSGRSKTNGQMGAQQKLKALL